MRFFSRINLNSTAATHRKVWAVACFVLAVLGQSIIREPQPVSSFKWLTEVLTAWNDKFYLLLKNPVNIALGLAAILLSILLYSRLSQSPDAPLDEFANKEGGSSWKKFLPWGLINLGIHALVLVQLARHQYSTLLLWVWIGTLLIFTFLFWKNEPADKSKQGLPLTHTDVIWMLALFAFAIASGSYLLNDLPAGWIPDEGPFWEMGRDIALGVKNPPFFDYGVFSFPSWEQHPARMDHALGRRRYVGLAICIRAPRRRNGHSALPVGT